MTQPYARIVPDYETYQQQRERRLEEELEAEGI
jgi:hypothetical protein